MKRITVWLLVMLLPVLVFPVYGDTAFRAAVLPFDDGSIRGWGGWKIGTGVVDEMITAFYNLSPQRFQLIEREKVWEVLDEQDFGASGRIDANTAAKIGQILGAQFLITGTVTEFSHESSGGGLGLKSSGLGLRTTTSRVVIDARVVDATSAEIVAAAKGSGEKKAASLSLEIDSRTLEFGSDEFRQTNLGIALREAVEQVTKEFNEKAAEFKPATGPALAGLVAYADSSRVIINIGAEHGVRPGMIFKVEKVMMEIKDPVSGEVIDIITDFVGEIQADEVREKATTCSIKSATGDIDIQDRVVEVR